MESMPARTRKIASGILQAGWPIGVMIAAGAGILLTDGHAWRPMFLVGIVPALLTLPLWFMFPNSKPAPKAGTAKRSAIKELATPGVPRMLVIGAAIMSLGFIVYYGLQTQYAFMLATELHLSANSTMAHVVLFNAGMLVGCIIAGVVAARRGVIVALVVPALLMVPALPLYVGWIGGPVPLAIGAVLGGAFGVGYSGVTPVLTTSLFPEHVRARAIGLVYHVGAFVAAFVPSLIPWLVSSTHWHLSTVMMLVVGSALVLMSAAILALRSYITPSDAPAAHVEVEPALPRATARELSPIASAIVDREVAKAAERRAILG
jgi:SHS family lactate transporter-like MFS transporter